MNRELLEEMAASKKKNSLSNARKSEFRIELEKALQEEGITKATVSYIFTCASLGSGISFFNWIGKMDEMQINELYTRLISTKEFGENTSMNSARILLTLVVEAMGKDKKFSFMIADAIKKLPSLLLTKDGKMGANVNKIVIYNYIEYVGTYKKWTALDELDLSDIERKQFISIINRAVSEYQPKSERQRNAKRNIVEWLRSETTKLEKKSSDKDNITNTEDESGNVVFSDRMPEEQSAGMIKEQMKTDSNINEENKSGSSEIIIHRKSVLAKKMIELASYVEAIETENERIHKELTEAKKENENIRRMYDRAKQSIQEKDETLAALTEEVEDVQKQLEEKKKNVEELEISIQKQSDVYSVYSSDSESRHIEKMNAIAAKLKGEYKDFLESKTMEMTIDLGLNLRDQLEDVFEILMRNGIDIKGR